MNPEKAMQVINTSNWTRDVSVLIIADRIKTDITS